ncbi:MAG: hypothetical protein JKY37_21745 [Nannocystaceae bacterium]|nr:hypothetical protein [Nannocystaceae bacterium]
MRCTLAASIIAITSLFTSAGCDRSGSTHRPQDDSLHLPRVGVGEFHAEEEHRPVEVEAVLPRTSPRTLQDALQKEIEVVEHIVELWWASRPIHEDATDPRVPLVFNELREQARSMDTPGSYTEALRYALCSLGDGHLRLVDEPGATRKYFSGLHFDRAGDHIVVSSRSVGTGKGAQPEPQGRDKLIAADGTPIDEWMDRLCLAPGSTKQHRHAVALASLRQQSRFIHEQPTPRELTLQRHSGETYTIQVDWHALDRSVTTPCVRGVMLDKKHKIGMLRVHTLWCEDDNGALSDVALVTQLRAAAKSLRTATHIVVDLRGNPGGTAWAGRRVLGMLRPGRTVWTQQRTRHPYRATAPRETIEHQPAATDPKLKSVPLWVLIDAGCADTCELLAGALRATDKVTMVGRATAGSVGNVATFRLPYTGLRIAVPVTEHSLPGSDLNIEGRGIAPEIEVVRAPSDIGVGANADLEVALERIRALQ